jgi:hypothetical protein
MADAQKTTSDRRMISDGLCEWLLDGNRDEGREHLEDGQSNLERHDAAATGQQVAKPTARDGTAAPELCNTGSRCRSTQIPRQHLG